MMLPRLFWFLCQTPSHVGFFLAILCITFVGIDAAAFEVNAAGSSAQDAVPQDAVPQATAETASVGSPISPKEQLDRELAEAKEAFREWGMTRKIRTFGVIADDPAVDRTRDIDWSAQTPIRTIHDNYLRSGDSFRSERSVPKSDQLVYAYNGQIARVRDAQYVLNGPLRRVVHPYERDLSPKLPHCMLVNYYYAGYLDWLFGSAVDNRMMRTHRVVGEPKIESVEFQGHPCWKIAWRVVSNDEIELTTICEVLLARDRSLLPIHQIYKNSIDQAWGGEIWTIAIDSFQTDAETGTDYPLRVTMSQQFNGELQVTLVDFEPDNRFKQSPIFSDAPSISPQQTTPPKATLSVYAPAELLSSTSGPVSNSVLVREAFETKLPQRWLMGFAALCLVIAVFLYLTPIGLKLRCFLGRHRYLLGIGGIIAMAGIGYLCSFPPGWTSHGMAMIVAGLFGILWIVFSMILIGNKQVSIRSVLFVAMCIAICFAGYNRGIKRIEVRQRMIREVGEEGGHVVIGNWHLNEDGLYMPSGLRRVFGEAWSGRASSAAVEQESFTADNIDNWCLDEVEWLGIASSTQQPFQINGDALAKIRDKGSLWTLHVEGGYLGADAIVELAQFHRLIDLHYDCQYQPVSNEIKGLSGLERLWLSNAIIDDDLIDSLKAVPNLDHVTLIRPRFGVCHHMHEQLPMNNIEIQHVNLASDAWNTLGKLGTALQIVDCRIQLPKTVTLQLTNSVLFQNCDVSDASLVQIAQSPKLVSVALSGTEVSTQGIEAFSQLRPEVYLIME